MKRAQQEGIPFSAVLKMATKAYADGSLKLSLIEVETFNERTRKELKAAYADARAGRNMSPKFKTPEEAIAYLRNPRTKK